MKIEKAAAFELEPSVLGRFFESPWYKTLFGLYANFTAGTVNFFTAEGLDPALMPVTTGSISSPMGLGSDSLPVKIDLFGHDTYLADSMQFNLELLLRFANKGVYYVMPTFRGEEPDERHLNQFFHAEAEIVGGLDDVMSLVERYVRHVSVHMLNRMGPAIAKVAGSTAHIEAMLADGLPFRKVTFDEASKLLGGNKNLYNWVESEPTSLSRAGEAALMQASGGVVWVTHLPAIGVPFYQADAPIAGRALCADLLFGIGEVVGCGQRNATFDEVEQALKARHVSPDEYRWYLEMKRRQPISSSGFGLGVERYFLWLLNHRDIRDMALFDRLKR